jgi:hypothetical protein
MNVCLCLSAACFFMTLAEVHGLKELRKFTETTKEPLQTLKTDPLIKHVRACARSGDAVATVWLASSLLPN